MAKVNEEWVLFQTFEGLGAAEAMRSWLASENVLCKVEPRTLDGGVAKDFCVFVSKELAHRARWVVNQLPPTDAELEFLATGKLPRAEDK